MFIVKKSKKSLKKGDKKNNDEMYKIWMAETGENIDGQGEPLSEYEVLAQFNWWLEDLEADGIISRA